MVFSNGKWYYNIIYYYNGINENEIWMNRDCFHTTACVNFDKGGKAIQRSPPDNFTQWI